MNYYFFYLLVGAVFFLVGLNSWRLMQRSKVARRVLQALGGGGPGTPEDEGP
jgi:hypothetical protein